MTDRKGFVLPIVLSFVLLLAISSAAIFFLVGTEAAQSRRTVAMTKAFYAAEAGAERMYAYISNNPSSAAFQEIQDSLLLEDAAVCNYSAATGGLSGHPDYPGDTTRAIISIASTGEHDGVMRDVAVQYELMNIDWVNPSMLSISDNVSLQGHRKKFLWWWITAGIDAEGPVASGNGVNIGDPQQAVTVTGEAVEGVSLVPPSFMNGFDANRDNDQIGDANGDGRVTYDEIPIDPETGDPFPDQEAIFLADDVNGDNVVDEEDGFVHYYTKVANYGYDLDGDGNPDSLGMDPDNPVHPYYYEGDVDFGPEGGAPYLWDSVPDETNIVFVNGDVNIWFNPDSWNGGARDITIVSTGDIDIVEPCNGDDDRLTLVSYRDISTGGINLSFVDLVDANLNAYAHGGMYAYYGGDTEGTLISNDIFDVDTMLASLLFAREISNTDNIVTNPPMGLPPMNNSDLGQLFSQNVALIARDFDVVNKPYAWSSQGHQED